MGARLWATASVAVGLLLTSAPSSAFTLTGTELLASPNASFPTVTPVTVGNSIVVGGGAPFSILIRYRVNPDSALPDEGDVTIHAIWNMTRLTCTGFCAGGYEDWDPRFFLSDGSTMIGWGLADNNAGSVVPMSAADAETVATSEAIYDVYGGADIPAIDAATEVALTFTLHNAGASGTLRYMGRDWSFSWFQTLRRDANLALVLSQDNDSGERYQVNSLQFSDPAAIPEPTTLALLAGGLAGLAAARRRRQ